MIQEEHKQQTTIATGSKVFFGLILKRNHAHQHKQEQLVQSG